MIIGVLSIISSNWIERMCISMANKKKLQGKSEDKTTSIITQNEITAGVVSNVKDITDCNRMEEQSQEIGNLLNKYKEGLAMIKSKLQKENSAFNNKDVSNLTALVVDHNSKSRTAFVKMLNNLKITTKEVNNGFFALEELKHADEPFSLILLEIDMPKMDGFELAARIRKNPEWDDTIIMLAVNKITILVPNKSNILYLIFIFFKFIFFILS